MAGRVKSQNTLKKNRKKNTAQLGITQKTKGKRIRLDGKLAGNNDDDDDHVGGRLTPAILFGCRRRHWLLLLLLLLLWHTVWQLILLPNIPATIRVDGALRRIAEVVVERSERLFDLWGCCCCSIRSKRGLSYLVIAIIIPHHVKVEQNKPTSCIENHIVLEIGKVGVRIVRRRTPAIRRRCRCRRVVPLASLSIRSAQSERRAKVRSEITVWREFVIVVGVGVRLLLRRTTQPIRRPLNGAIRRLAAAQAAHSMSRRSATGAIQLQPLDADRFAIHRARAAAVDRLLIGRFAKQAAAGLIVGRELCVKLMGGRLLFLQLVAIVDGCRSRCSVCRRR